MHRSLLGWGMMLLAAGQLFIATGARADERRPVEVTAASPNATFVGSGFFVFSVSYVASVLVAETSEHPGDNRLYVPVAGPWLDFANRGDCGPASGRSCADETSNKALLVVDGVFQGLGALAMIGGLLFPETYVAAKTAKSDPPHPTFHLTPARIGAQGYGLAAFGTF